MKEIMELYKSAVEALEKVGEAIKDFRNSDEKVELSTLVPGDEFKTDIGDFIVLEQEEGTTKVITKELYKENVAFGECNDYRKSKVRKLCDNEILKDFESVFGADNIVEHDVDLTTLDGQKMFGEIKSKVRPLAFDEARKHNSLIVDKSLPDWYWTVTAWSSEERGYKYSIAVVAPSGYVNDYDFNGVSGVRPFCILKSNIFVSKESK